MNKLTNFLNAIPLTSNYFSLEIDKVASRVIVNPVQNPGDPAYNKTKPIISYLTKLQISCPTTFSLAIPAKTM